MPEACRTRPTDASLYGVAASETVTSVPSPSRLVSVIVPPCCSTSAREIARPRPVPGIAWRVAVDARKKREKTWPSRPQFAGASTPRPSPARQQVSLDAHDELRPPFAVDLTAFRDETPDHL